MRCRKAVVYLSIYLFHDAGKNNGQAKDRLTAEKYKTQHIFQWHEAQVTQWTGEGWTGEGREELHTSFHTTNHW